MKITEEMLYAAAPEAAERWLDTLPKREDCDFSLTFEASMRPLLRRRRRVGRTMVLLAAVIAALAVLGVSAERPDEYRVYAAQEEGYVSYLIRPKDDGIDQPLHPLTAAWVPEGLFLQRADVQLDQAAAYYRDGAEERTITLKQWHGGEESGILSQNCRLERIQVDGEDAIYIVSSKEPFSYLLWTRGADGFILRAKNLEKTEIVRFAESLEW